jgi:lipopolysaccharide transport system ATP-binding protein
MDQDIAVRVEGLSKIYRLGLKANEQDSFVKMLASFVRSPFANYRKYRSLYNFDDVADSDLDRDDIIWALRDVSFEVKRGEVIGIVGRNGAGKSTLLKILTRITPPARGRVEINGRVSSLLEVGTGFHQELTGRENIYLNGTILGMSKVEVDRKFDEIVDFSGVERFLDTPVKRYSSGMVVRLAFAVAAHLEPEILIVDEVLAVGDAAFQKKCIDKMKDVGKHGRTVLFVSHNMPAIAMLCSRGIFIDRGRIALDGPTHDVITRYTGSGSGFRSISEWPDASKAPGADIARLRSARVLNRSGLTVSSVDVTEEVGLEMAFDVLQPGHRLMPMWWFYNDEGAMVFGVNFTDPDWDQRPFPTGRCVATAWIPGNLLTSGTLFVTPWLVSLHPTTVQFDEPQAIGFHVKDNMGSGTARGDWPHDMPGAFRPLLRWTTQVESAKASVVTRAIR